MPRFGVPKQFRPAQDFHVEAVVAEPSEPPKSIWHRCEVLLKFQPLSYFFSQVANYVPLEWHCAIDNNITTSVFLASRSERYVYVPTIDIVDGGAADHVEFERLY